MADIFISYARTERAKAERIKGLLEALGLSVFFDVDGLDGGDVFPDVLDREVKTAGVVLGLWSPHALSRPWIRTECLIGKDRGVLIPAVVEPINALIDVPAAFYGLQHIDLTMFRGDTSDPEWISLIKSLSRTLNRPELLAREARAHEPGTEAREDLREELTRMRAELESMRAAASPGSAPASPSAVRVAKKDRKTPAFVWWILIAFAASVLGLCALNPFRRHEVIPDSPLVEAPAETGAPADPSGGPASPAPAAADASQATSCSPISFTIYFEYDKTALAPDALGVLDASLAKVGTCRITAAVVNGYGEHIGTEAYATTLSFRRAEAVADALRSQGVPSDVIATYGRGWEDMAIPTVSGEREPLNRRVVVDFTLAPS